MGSAACYRGSGARALSSAAGCPPEDQPLPRSPSAPAAPPGTVPPDSASGLEWLRGFVAARSPTAVVVGEGVAETGAPWQTLRLTSQTWRGVAWVHELDVVFPAAPASRGPMLLWVGSGSSVELPAADGPLEHPPRGVGWLADLVAATGLPAAMIRQVPFQPMFGGMVEDDLIAYSFMEFVRSGEPDWPLLLPMTRAVVAAMDVVGQVAGEAGIGVDGFVLGGSSKRGWASWLAAAADSRVVGLVPAVIDMLRLARHVPLQLATFGGRISEMLDDYTSRGIEQILLTKRGRELVDVVDPWSHRAVLGQPKIVALGTNDPYWPLEACGLYYDGLPGPRWVSYCPNAGHGLPVPRIAALVAAMGRHVAGIEPLPPIDWRFEATAAGGAECVVACETQPERVTLWTAGSESRDFRLARWSSEPVEAAGAEWRVPIARPAQGFVAGLVELEFAREPVPLMLTSGVKVLRAT